MNPSLPLPTLPRPETSASLSPARSATARGLQEEAGKVMVLSATAAAIHEWHSSVIKIDASGNLPQLILGASLAYYSPGNTWATTQPLLQASIGTAVHPFVAGLKEAGNCFRRVLTTAGLAADSAMTESATRLEACIQQFSNSWIAAVETTPVQDLIPRSYFPSEALQHLANEGKKATAAVTALVTAYKKDHPEDHTIDLAIKAWERAIVENKSRTDPVTVDGFKVLHRAILDLSHAFAERGLDVMCLVQAPGVAALLFPNSNAAPSPTSPAVQETLAGIAQVGRALTAAKYGFVIPSFGKTPAHWKCSGEDVPDNFDLQVKSALSLLENVMLFHATQRSDTPSSEFLGNCTAAIASFGPPGIKKLLDLANTGDTPAVAEAALQRIRLEAARNDGFIRCSGPHPEQEVQKLRLLVLHSMLAKLTAVANLPEKTTSSLPHLQAWVVTELIPAAEARADKWEPVITLFVRLLNGVNAQHFSGLYENPAPGNPLRETIIAEEVSGGQSGPPRYTYRLKRSDER